MKKIISLLFLLIIINLITGCGSSATKAVENYLNEYNMLSDNVTKNMKDIVNRENFKGQDRKTYMDIFKKQYKDMKYEIVDEAYDGDEAIIKAKINVYDLYKVQNSASSYLANHADEFNDANGNYDVNMFIKYKLDKMKNISDRVDYTIDFYVVNTTDGWVVSSLSNSDLEKIHGIYNYEI